MELPVITLRDGVRVEEDVTLTSSDSTIVEVSGNKLIGRGIGTAIVTATLNRNNTITEEFTIEVTEQHELQTAQLFIEGSDYIEWNGYEDYYLSTKEPMTYTYDVQSKIRCSVDEITNEEGQPIGVRISVKDKYSGKIVLTCTAGDTTVEKIIYIRTV